MDKKMAHFTLRVEPDVKEKYLYICQYEGESMNGMLLSYISNVVRRYEEKNGFIPPKT